MKLDKGLMAGSGAMLVLKLLESGDMYGYQMIEQRFMGYRTLWWAIVNRRQNQLKNDQKIKKNLIKK